MKIKIAKIVGATNKTSWSQVHVFKPEGEKLESHGQLMAVLSFEAKKEDISVSSFGTEIITRLQEIYYTNDSDSVLKKVSQTMESLAAEFLSEVKLEIVMMVLWKSYLYVGKNSGGREGNCGKIFLKRGEDIVSLFEETKEMITMSGELKEKDTLIACSGRFIEIVPLEKIELALKEIIADKIVESLSPVVHGHDDNYQAAAIVVKSEKEEKVTDKEEKVMEKEKKAMNIQKVRNFFKKKTNNIKLRDNNKYSGNKKSKAILILFLVVAFGISIFFNGRKKQKEKTEKEYQVLIEEIEYKYNEAEKLIELNPLRAKFILRESKQKIEQYKKDQNGENTELNEFSKRIEEKLAGLKREYEVKSADEWFTFDLIKKEFQLQDLESEENNVLLIDKLGKTVINVDLQTKASRIIIGGDKLLGGDLIGVIGERGFVIDKSSEIITVIDIEKGETISEVEGDGWSDIKDVVGFSGNVYLLDSVSNGQIFKYVGFESGLSQKRTYLEGESLDLSEAISMAIDGSVWVLFTDGTIVKYIRGQKDSFVVTGLEKDFVEPIKIFTSPEVENLYILDKKETRVVVINKSGVYQAQYKWPGIAGVDDFIVSESLGKIFFVTDQKIFTIDLRE